MLLDYLNNTEVIIMKRTCSQCRFEMIEDCKVTVEGDLSGVIVTQKRKGLFKNISAKTKAAVCPNCGNVALYVEDHKKFMK